MIIFIENLCGLQIVAHAPEFQGRWAFKVVRDSIADYAPEGLSGPILRVRPGVLRYMKTILGALQFPIVQQDPQCLAFRLNLWRRVLSDGMLTEYWMERRGPRARRFYSVQSGAPAARVIIREVVIIGSNWLEYGSMSEGSYRRHLEFLRDAYPGAPYFCHPRETNPLPEAVFGPDGVRRLQEPVESFLSRVGVPAQMVSVCSSAVLSLALGHEREIEVHLVRPAHYDGPTGDAIRYTKHEASGPDRISVNDLQDFLRDKLSAAGVAVRDVPQG